MFYIVLQMPLGSRPSATTERFDRCQAYCAITRASGSCIEYTSGALISRSRDCKKRGCNILVHPQRIPSTSPIPLLPGITPNRQEVIMICTTGLHTLTLVTDMNTLSSVLFPAWYKRSYSNVSPQATNISCTGWFEASNGTPDVCLATLCKKRKLRSSRDMYEE